MGPGQVQRVSRLSCGTAWRLLAAWRTAWRQEVEGKTSVQHRAAAHAGEVELRQQPQQPPPPRMNMMMGRPPHATPHQHHPMTQEMAPPMHLARAPPHTAPAAAAIDEPEEGELRDS